MTGQSFASLEVTSSAFGNQGFMPKRYTGYGEDVSPELSLNNLSEAAVSIAIIMNDMNHPIPAYNHWVIWNIPPRNTIPENIPHGETVTSLDGAVQGRGYGKHRYKGPRPPFFLRKPHHYPFHVYVLDCKLKLDGNGGKADLLKAMEGHVIQYGSITGVYKNGEGQK